jgi:hypothetical protein
MQGTTTGHFSLAMTHDMILSRSMQRPCKPEPIHKPRLHIVARPGLTEHHAFLTCYIMQITSHAYLIYLEPSASALCTECNNLQVQNLHNIINDMQVLLVYVKIS